MTDFTPDAYFPDDCVITIQRKGGNAQTITTDVTNFTDGGGTKDTESVAHFGGAKLTVKQAQEDFEVSFDVDINDTTWAYVMTGTQTTAGSATRVTSDGTQTNYKVKLEWVDPDTTGSAGFKLVYYNALGVTYEKESGADDYLKGTVGFKLTSQDASGSGQRYEIECDDFDDTLGSGSYVAWETTSDTYFGFS